MNFSEKLGFTWNLESIVPINPATNPKKPSFILKKMMEEYVWDITHLEDNPYSFIDVQTLLGGTTVSGHSIQDQTQVLNQEKSLKRLIDSISEKDAKLSKNLVLNFHSFVAKEEALSWGAFRDGQVGIGGTTHMPPPPNNLDNIFSSGLQAILQIQNPVEQALVYFFWGSMNQFFYDGNKRTSRLVMNFILMRSNYYYLSIPGSKKEEFNQLMVEFYNTKQANDAISFILSCYKNWD